MYVTTLYKGEVPVFDSLHDYVAIKTGEDCITLFTDKPVTPADIAKAFQDMLSGVSACYVPTLPMKPLSR